MEKVKIIKSNNPRINKVTHKYNGVSTWEEILKKIVINHLKADNYFEKCQ